MEPLTWFTVARLITTVGMEVTDFIIRKQAAGATVTLAEWDELHALAARTPQTQLTDAIAALGLDPHDPHVAAVRALAGEDPAGL